MTALRDPIRLIPLLFLGAIVVGTALLSLPIATTDGTRAPLLTAVFTSTSAVAVTGLIVVDTPTYWSGFGQGVILLLFQIGGYDVTVVGVKREGEDFIHAVPDTIVFPGDELVVSGRIAKIEKFSAI